MSSSCAGDSQGARGETGVLLGSGHSLRRQVLKKAALCHQQRPQGLRKKVPQGVPGLSAGQGQREESQPRPGSWAPDQRSSPDLRPGSESQLSGGEAWASLGASEAGRMGAAAVGPRLRPFICSAEQRAGGQAPRMSPQPRARLHNGPVASCRAGPRTRVAEGFQEQGATRGLDLIRR